MGIAFRATRVAHAILDIFLERQARHAGEPPDGLDRRVTVDIREMLCGLRAREARLSPPLNRERPNR
jgi:hypothetical protein